MKCPICQKEIAENTLFCVNYGKKIPRCPSCGEVIRRKKFCIKDGIELPKEILQMHFAGILIIMQYMIIVKLGKKQSSIVNFWEDIW